MVLKLSGMQIILDESPGDVATHAYYVVQLAQEKAELKVIIEQSSVTVLSEQNSGTVLSVALRSEQNSGTIFSD
jgi:hypothetical protein